MISHYVKTYMHKRLDNMQSKSDFTVLQHVRLVIGLHSLEPENTALTVTNHNNLITNKLSIEVYFMVSKILRVKNPV